MCNTLGTVSRSEMIRLYVGWKAGVNEFCFRLQPVNDLISFFCVINVYEYTSFFYMNIFRV